MNSFGPADGARLLDFVCNCGLKRHPPPPSPSTPPSPLTATPTQTATEFRDKIVPKIVAVLYCYCLWQPKKIGKKKIHIVRVLSFFVFLGPELSKLKAKSSRWKSKSVAIALLLFPRSFFRLGRNNYEDIRLY